MKAILLPIVILFIVVTFTSCATKTKIVKVPVKPTVKSWAEKKRECHTYYLNVFGLTKSDTIAICKEELERAN